MDLFASAYSPPPALRDNFLGYRGRALWGYWTHFVVSLLRIDSLVPMGLVIELFVVMREYLMNADKHCNKTQQDKKWINPNRSKAHHAHNLNEDKKER